MADTADRMLFVVLVTAVVAALATVDINRMNLVQTVSTEVERLQAPLVADVSLLKMDVSELKTDVSELKTDVSQLKTDVSELKTDVRKVLTLLEKPR